MAAALLVPFTAMADQCIRLPQLNGDPYTADGTRASCLVGGNGHAACVYNWVNDGFGVVSCSGSPVHSCIVDACGRGVCG